MSTQSLTQSSTQKPMFNLIRLNNNNIPPDYDPSQNGGSGTNLNGGHNENQPMHDDEYYLYKAKKYHYKNQACLKGMMAQGKSCPSGFEKYLQPFTR